MAQSDFVVKNGLVVLNGLGVSSTSTNSGAIVVQGGLGLSENLIVGGQFVTSGTNTLYGPLSVLSTQDNYGVLHVRNTSTAAGTTSGALVVDGGVGIGGNLFVAGTTYLSGDLYVDGSQTFVNTQQIATGDKTIYLSTGATSKFLASNSGIVVGATGTGYISWLYDGDNNWVSSGGLSVTNTLTVISSVQSTSTDTGALVVAGGVGIKKDLYVGGTAYINNFAVLTTGTIGNYGVVDIRGGTDTAVSNNVGLVVVWNTSTLQTVTGRGATTTNAITILNTLTVSNIGVTSTSNLQDVNVAGQVNVTNTTQSSSTSTGAVVIQGGLGVVGNLYAGAIYDQGSRIITTSTIGTYGPSSITAGTDTAVSTATGAVVIWNTSTLQTVTDRGSTTTNIIHFANTTNSTGVTTGAVVIDGGVGIAQDVYIGGTLFYSNTLNITSKTSSTSTTTGAVVVAGGVGIGENLNVGGSLNVNTASYIAGGLILTTNNDSPYVVTSLTAGTDTAVSTSSGAVVVWNTSTLDTIAHRGNTATVPIVINTVSGQALYVAGGVLFSNTLTVLSTSTLQDLNVTGLTQFVNTANSTSTLTGAVTLNGGLGVQGNVYANAVYDQNARVITTATIPVYAVTSLTAGTDTALSTSTGPVVVWNTSTLQTITNRGSTTTNAITIANTGTSSLLVFGGANIGGNLEVGGNIHAVGNITADGNITLGNQTGTDTLYIGAEVTSDILPKNSGVYNIGNPTQFWDNLWANSVHLLGGTASTSTTTGAMTVAGGVGVGGNLNVGGSANITGGLSVGGALNVNGVNFGAYAANVWYVSSLIGNDTTGDGRKVESSFATIKKALSVSTSGDTINVLPGTYTEIFPLTIPSGVAVHGSGLREVFVQPTTATNTQTAFLLNGETTLSDMAVGKFYKPGTALAFAPGMKTIKRSPYVERFTVLTTGSTTNDSDPYGYDANDAGGGGYFDGALVDRTSIEPAILFNEVTFITPNATAVYLTNGTRCELLNGFCYFADRAVHAKVGTQGYGGVGQVRLKLANISGTINTGDYLYYKGSTGTVVASGQIASVNSTSNYVFINGYQPGFEEASNRSGKVVNVYGGTYIDTSVKKFGLGSARFTTDGDFLDVVNSTDFQFETGAYTLEAFVRLVTNSRLQYVFNKGTEGGSTTFGLYINSSNQLVGIHGNSLCTGTNTLTTGVWYHVALSRDAANTTRVFLNGNLEASTTSTANITNGSGLTIGGVETDTTVSLRGYMDEVRVSNVGRYTASFTAPSAPFTSDNSTVLLLHCDGVQGSISFADDGTGTQTLYTTTGSSTGTVIATAQQVTLADYTQFGAELRCIGSAAVFGNYGVVGDGVGVDLKLIAYNMSYIGSGKDLSDDPTLAVQANEVVKLNGAKIYYQTVDQLGDFRVGDQFRINQRTGNVDFGTANFRLGPLTSLTISDGVNASILQPTSIAVGSLLLAGNRVQTISGNLVIAPSGSLTTVNSDLQVNGQLTFTGQLRDTSVAASTSTTTGAIVVAGGLGVGGDVHVGGNVYSSQGQPLYSPKVTVSTTPPTTATNNIGDFWIDPSIGVEYQWIQDGSNFYWIQFTGV